MKRRITSILLSITILLSAIIIVPATYKVDVNAAYDPSLGMYSNLNNVFTGQELSKSVIGINQSSFSYDNTEKALKYVINNVGANDDPYIWFDLKSAGIDLSQYTQVVVIYKMPLSNRQEWQRTQFWWWNTSGTQAASGTYDSNCAWYRCGSYYFDIRPNLVTSGTLSQFRIDPFTWATFWNAGDVIYIDSIAFFKTTDEAQLYRREREAVRNKESDTFTIQPSAFNVNNAFSYKHNVNVTYNSSYDAFQLTTAYNCTVSGGGDLSTCGGGKYVCNNYVGGANTVFDPYVNLSCNIDTNKYKYMVVSYCMPMRGNAATLAGIGNCANWVSSNYIYDASSENANYMQIKPIFSSGTDATSYGLAINCQFDPDLRTYIYTQIIDLSACGSNNSITGIRIDPVNYTFSKIGSYVYLKEITFATTTSAAASCAETMLSKMTGYSHFNTAVTMNANAISGTTVSNMPSVGNSLKYESHPGASTYSYAIPGTPPTSSNSGIGFDGWATNSTGSAVVSAGGTYTVSASGGQIAKPVLYAKWSYMYGTLTVTAANGSSNIHENQTYIFRISGTGLDPAVGQFSITVPLSTGQSTSLSLPMGSYKVECISGWSWRYSTGSPIQTVTLTQGGQVGNATFTFNSKNESWLNDLFAQIIS